MRAQARCVQDPFCLEPPEFSDFAREQMARVTLLGVCKMAEGRSTIHVRVSTHRYNASGGRRPRFKKTPSSRCAEAPMFITEKSLITIGSRGGDWAANELRVLIFDRDE